MSGYGFSLTPTEDTVLVQENTGQRKPVICHVLHSEVYHIIQSIIKNTSFRICTI